MCEVVWGGGTRILVLGRRSAAEGSEALDGGGGVELSRKTCRDPSLKIIKNSPGIIISHVIYYVLSFLLHRTHSSFYDKNKRTPSAIKRTTKQHFSLKVLLTIVERFKV